MALHKEEESLCREMGDKRGLQISLGNQAGILDDRGNPDRAIVLMKEQERLCRELCDPESLTISLANQAVILKRVPGHRGEARCLADEALSIASRSGLMQLATGVQRIRNSIPPD